MTMPRWGALAAFVLAVAFVLPSSIYLVGELRAANGPLTYSLADLLYGPVWAACLVVVVGVLREQLREVAPRRMDLALLAALGAGATFLGVASIRAANRHYHLQHPELHLENSVPVLVVWATLVAGVIAAAWQFLGWAYLLTGSAGWTSRRLPRALSTLYLAAGAAALAVFFQPDVEGLALVLGLAAALAQGVQFLRVEPGGRPALAAGIAGAPNPASGRAPDEASEDPAAPYRRPQKASVGEAIDAAMVR